MFDSTLHVKVNNCRIGSATSEVNEKTRKGTDANWHTLSAGDFG